MASPGDPTRRARVTLVTSVALLVVLALGAGTAAGQEDPPAGGGGGGGTGTSTSTTTTTAPPVTIDLGDGDIGVLPPGADGDESGGDGTGDPNAGDPNDPFAPSDEELEVDEELPVVILPDPTPGLNAALADLGVSRARDALADGEEGRRLAEARLDEAYAARAEALAERRAAGERLQAAESLVDEFAVRMIVHGDQAALEPLFGEADLDDLRALTLSDAVADRLQTGLADARERYRKRLVAEQEADEALAAAEQIDRFGRALYLSLRRQVDEAIRDAAEARRQLGPEILGPAVVDQASLVAWYRTYYRADPPMGSIESIIEAYLRVGEEEGVMGDVAFAQAILETGGFRSGHARKWNFAGIGAYDHCAPNCSFGFPSLEEGVRAHIHLLRAYADPGLTTAQLASTPNRAVAPERVGVRGCCQRWTELTGVWATDVNYDRKVLGIYRLMVETARALDRLSV